MGVVLGLFLLLANDPFPEGMVSITLDDGWSSQMRGAELLDAHGIRASFYLSSEAIEKNWAEFLDRTEVRSLLASGHEVESHTVTHPDMPTLTDEEMIWELEASRDFLRETFGTTKAHHFATPFGHYDTRIIELIRPRYESHRTVVKGRNWRDGNPYELLAYDVHSTVTPEDVADWLVAARAERRWVILLFHEFVDGSADETTEINIDDFATILDTIDRLGLTTVTVAEGVAMMKGAVEEPPPPLPPPPLPPPTGPTGPTSTSGPTGTTGTSGATGTTGAPPRATPPPTETGTPTPPVDPPPAPPPEVEAPRPTEEPQPIANAPPPPPAPATPMGDGANTGLAPQVEPGPTGPTGGDTPAGGCHTTRTSGWLLLSLLGLLANYSRCRRSP